MTAPTPESLAMVRMAIDAARHEAWRARGTYWGRMAPEPLPVERTIALVGAAGAVAWHAAWMLGALEKLLGRAEAMDERERARECNP